ncbi:MAG TPA: response regulator transcription factor [Pseudogracilibacillus sp.]|nr:response regulator transcription factor [Pseudogracilibacillus sp.]
MQKIYIVEDDHALAELLEKTIQKYDYETKAAVDFQNILEDFEKFAPHLVLLDINLPSFDGFYWCRQLRQISTCPIIFISARVGEMDQIMALENGGDDFITKPFHPEIVLAKVRSQLRRAYGEYAPELKERTIAESGLVLYPERLELHFKERIQTLSKNEAYIIEMLLDRYPRVAGREDLLETIWDEFAFVDDNTLNVNVTRVRKQLQELGIQDAIETVRGVGYRLHVTW